MAETCRSFSYDVCARVRTPAKWAHDCRAVVVAEGWLAIEYLSVYILKEVGAALGVHPEPYVDGLARAFSACPLR